MRRNPSDSTLKSTILFLVTVCTFLVWFIRKVIKAGRIFEFSVSTSILVLIYWVLVSTINYFKISLDIISTIIVLGFPIGFYSSYWVYLFSHEKVTSLRANLNWANRDWWWTLDGWEFEEEVARIFRLNGYKAKVTKKTGDGGIDIILYKDNEKYIVQCKHYQSQLPIESVRALNGVKEDFGADKLIMVASSGLSSAGYDFLKNKPYYITLDLEDIIRMGLRPSEDDVIDVEVIKEFPKLID